MKNKCFFAGIVSILLIFGLLGIGCSQPTDDNGKDTNRTPAAADYNIGNLSQTAGSVSAITITPKTGKSGGAVTIYYQGTGGTTYAKSTTLPTAGGTYIVTFDVAAASGLSAGTLTINPAGANHTHVWGEWIQTKAPPPKLKTARKPEPVPLIPSIRKPAPLPHSDTIGNG